MRPRDVIDTNLEKLLSRAYEPRLPRAAFRAALRERALAASHRPGPRLAYPRRAAHGWTKPFVAAAAVVLAALVTWLVREEPVTSYETILAADAVALRDHPDDAWRAAGSDHAILLDDAFLEVRTPSSRGLRVESVALGAIAVDSDSHAELGSTSAANAIRVTTWLRAGAVDVERRAGEGSFVVSSEHGTTLIERGAMRVWLTMNASVTRVHVLDGVAFVEHDGRHRLDAGTTWTLRPGSPPLQDPTAPVRKSEVEVVSGDQPDDAPPEPVDPAQGAVEPPIQLHGEARDAATDLPLEAFSVALVPFEIGGSPAYGHSPRVFDFDDASGTFAVRGVTAGRYRAFVRADGYSTWSSSLVDVGAGASAPALRAALPRGATLRGRVVDAATGAGVAGALVFSVTDAPLLLFPIQEFMRETSEADLLRGAHTDSNGGFELPHVSPGRQEVRVAKTGFAPATLVVDDVQNGESRPELRIELVTGGRVRGRVTQRDGTPWANTMVFAMRQGSERANAQLFGAGVTDEEGRYEITDLPPGTYVAILMGIDVATPEAEHSDISDTVSVIHVRVQSDELATADFFLHGTGTRLTGTILDAAGEPLAGAILSLGPAGDDEARDLSNFRGGRTDDAGRFEFAGVTPGRYEAYVIDGSGLLAQIIGTIDVPALPEVERSLRLEGGRIAGTASADQEPVPGYVVVERIVVDGDQFVAKLETDSSGRFEIKHLTAGLYRVSVVPKDGPLAVATTPVIQVDRDQTARVAVAMERGGSVAVVAVDGAGAPIPNASLLLTDARGAAFMGGWDPRTNADGTATLAHVPAGAWTLVVSEPTAGSFERTVVIEPGETIAVEARLEPKQNR